MTALSAYLGALLVIHLAWVYFYLCGTLVRSPRGAGEPPQGSGAALIEIVVATACGMALTGFATFLLGLAHLLYPLAIPLWLVVLGLVFARRADPPWRAPFWRARLALWRAAASPGALAIYAVALLYGLGSVRPDLGGDTTSYHLVYPTEWANAHALVVDLALRVPYYATNWLLLDVWLLMFHLVEATQTLSWLTSLLSLLGVYGYVVAAVERQNRPLEPFHVALGLLAAAALGGSTIFLETSVVALVDVPIGFFFLAAALALADAVRARRWDSLAACVLCAGFLIGMKTSLLLFYPLFAAGTAFAALRLGAGRRRVVLALAVLTVCAAPWYVKNFIQAGDPVSPTLNIALRGVDPHWSADDFHGLTYDLKLGEDNSPLGHLLVPLESLTEPASPAFRADGGTLIILLAWLPALLGALLIYRRGRVGELEPYVFACLVALRRRLLDGDLVPVALRADLSARAGRAAGRARGARRAARAALPLGGAGGARVLRAADRAERGLGAQHRDELRGLPGRLPRSRDLDAPARSQLPRDRSDQRRAAPFGTHRPARVPSLPGVRPAVLRRARDQGRGRSVRTRAVPRLPAGDLRGRDGGVRAALPHRRVPAPDAVRGQPPARAAGAAAPGARGARLPPCAVAEPRVRRLPVAGGPLSISRIAIVPGALAALLSACYGGPGTDSPALQRTYPLGVGAASPAPAPTGIYAMGYFGAYNCCWLTKSAAFATAIPSGGTRLRLMVSLPGDGPFDKRPETLTVRVGDERPKLFAGLRSGIYALDVPLAARGAARDALVRIDSTYTWQAEGSPYPRSVQLRGVRAL